MAKQHGLVCVLFGGVDTDRYPIPPTRVERSTTACVHTPQPSGYVEWHEWATLASKTHSAVKCQFCGLWKVWLPKSEAVKVRRKDAAEQRAFLKRVGSRRLTEGSDRA